jgi:hypothetical protein
MFKIAPSLPKPAPKPLDAPAPTPAAKPKPGAEHKPSPAHHPLHETLRQHPERRDAVYAQLVRTDAGLIHHLERWHHDDVQAADADLRLQAEPSTPAPRDPALQAIKTKKEALDSLRALSAAGGPGAVAVPQNEAALRQQVEAELRTAADAEPRYAGDPLTAEQRIDGRAAQIKALYPDDAGFAALVDQARTTVANERTVQAAAREVQRVYEQQGSVAAAQALDGVTAANPALADAIVDAAAPTVALIAQGLAAKSFDGRDDAAAGVAALAAAAERGGADTIAQALVAAGSDADFGVMAPGSRHGMGDADLNTALGAAVANGAGTELAIATAEALRAAGRVDAASRVDQALVSGIDRLREATIASREQYAQREQQLQQDLASFGPGLTADERAAYVEAYWADESTVPGGDAGDLPSNAEVRRQFLATDDALATALEQATPTLERLAGAGNEEAGEVLLDSYEALAGSPEHAQQAIDWVQRLEANPALFEAIDGFIGDDLATRLADGLKPQALESLASQLLVNLSAAPPEERQGLIDGFLDVARTLDSSGGYLDDIEGITQLNADWQEFQRLRALPEGHPDRLALTEYERKLQRGAESLLEGWSEQSRLGKSLAVVGLVVGFADSAQAFSNGEIPEGVLSAIGASKDAAEIGIGILGVIGQGGRVAGADAADLGLDAARVAGFGAKAADFGARFLPLVGLGLDAVQFADDIDQLRNNPNAGEVLATIGTGISLVGDVAEIVPVLGTVLGGALGAIGSLVHAIGGFVDGLWEGNEVQDALHERQRSYLEAAGLSEATAAQYVQEPYLLSLAENFGMRPEFVREWVMAHDGDLNYEQQFFLGLIADTAAAHGLTGTQAENFFHAALNSPDRAGLDDHTDYSNTVFGIGPTNAVLNGYGDHELQRAQLAQAEWFRVNMPGIYEQYFAPIPGAPTYAQPGFDGVNVGYLQDLQALYTERDPNIAGTAAP